MKSLLFMVCAAIIIGGPQDITFRGTRLAMPEPPAASAQINSEISHFLPTDFLTPPARPLLREMDESDLILGWINPDTVLVLSSDTVIYSNIILLGNARLEVRDCTLQYRGNIFLVGNSQMYVTNAVLNLFQDYDYQYAIRVMDSTDFRIENSTMRTAGFPYSMGGAGRSRFGMDNVVMDRAFITFGPYESCSLGVSNTVFPGEFVMVDGEHSTTLTGIDTLLIWFGFPIGSSGILDLGLDEHSHIDHMSFPNSDVSGIEYSLELIDVDGLMTGAMIYDSTDVTIRDTRLRTIGMIFEGIADTLAGFSNGLEIPIFEPHIRGRGLRLENCSVETWNFYGSGESNIMLDGMVFGEYIIDSEAEGQIYGSFCDGSGGHLGANGNSKFTMVYSTSGTLALLEGHSMSFIVQSSFIGRGGLVLRNSAIAISAYNFMANPPVIEDSSALIEVDISVPSVIRASDIVSIYGTALLERASESPLHFDGYRIAYHPEGLPDDRTWLSDFSTDEIDDDLLAMWNTAELEPGMYILTLWYYFSYLTTPDSAGFDYSVYVGESESISESLTPDDHIYVYPNPTNSILCIATPDIDSWTIHDPSGRILRVGRTSIVNLSELPSGVLILDIITPTGRSSTRIANVK